LYHGYVYDVCVQVNKLCLRSHLSSRETLVLAREVMKIAEKGYVHMDKLSDVCERVINDLKEERYRHYLRRTGMVDPRAVGLPVDPTAAAAATAAAATTKNPILNQFVGPMLNPNPAPAASSNSVPQEGQSGQDVQVEMDDVAAEVLSGLDVDEFEENMERGHGLDGWEVLALFRNSPLQNGYLELSEVLVGLSVLTRDYDFEQEEEILEAARVKRSKEKYHQPVRYRKKCLRPLTKTNVAWKTLDADKDGKLAHLELVHLLHRMARTGHIDGETLLVRTSAWNELPAWSVRSARDLAALYLERTAAYSTLQQAHEDWDPAEVLAALEKDESFRISLREFKAITLSLNRTRDLKLWYLENSTEGTLREKRQRWKERARVWAMQRGQTSVAEWVGGAHVSTEDLGGVALHTHPEEEEEEMRRNVVSDLCFETHPGEESEARLATHREIDEHFVIHTQLRLPSAPAPKENTSVFF
jgi:hypothetical protein